MRARLVATVSWRRSVEPHAVAWGFFYDRVHGRGKAHGCDLIGIAEYTPADACDLLCDMVDFAAIRPIAADVVGAPWSVRAFRTISPSAGSKINTAAWTRETAHLWTYGPKDPRPGVDG